MSTLLYHQDPYLREFEATVLAVDGEWVTLDRTAFYPGGGGQDPDTGWMDDLEVTGMRGEPEIGHRVPGHAFQVGDSVHGRIDWDRRHDLMRAHTGEHLLFSVLQRAVDDLEMVKISISNEGKSFIVGGSIDWNVLGEAQRRVNEAIRSGLEVRRVVVPRDDPSLADVRIKVDRIKGDSVSIVKIGDVDQAACAGVHVSTTSDIGALLIDRFSSAGKGRWLIGFQVGERAVEEALALATLALDASERMGSSPSDLPSAVTNLKEAVERQKKVLRSYCRAALEELGPELVGEVEVYHGTFDNLDRKALTEAADRYAQRGICILVSRGERASLIVAGDIPGLDCQEILNEVLADFGGRGGGKATFAQGGCPDDRADELEQACLGRIRERMRPSP